MAETTVYRILRANFYFIFLPLLTFPATAAPVDSIKVDFRALIRAAAPSPVQFAVQVPYAASTATAGAWSSAGDRSTWRYTSRIPTAVSMSFHANPIQLPPGATLTVSNASTTVVYRANDLKSSDLWSRIHPGDTLDFTLEVATSDRSLVQFNIVSFQGGYRSLGAGVKDHPYYRELKSRTSGSANSGCVQNYECSISVSNTPAAQGTVGLTIGNAFQCTGTLINDVPGDNTPYVLTARHCENGVLGGGDPSAASTVTVYWDATTPCGQALGALYDPGVATQTGATTVVEQQDAWLIQLHYSPVVADAQFVGFDASGGATQAGYTVHHALGNNKQFTAWFGQAIALQQSDVLGVNYVSNFLEVVNQLGNVGPGASGSALIDQNNHLVGSLTLGRTGDSSGYGSCPVTPPSAPNGTNGDADFTALAAIWNSTADTSSSTGTSTLKSTLDPAATGTFAVSSTIAAPISFTSSTYSLGVASPAILSWNAPNATQCTASGGNAGDGWSGTLPSSGTQSIMETVSATLTYTLTCSVAGGRTVRAYIQIQWYGGTAAQVQLYPSDYEVWATRPLTLTWSSNVMPCSLSGGSLSLSNLASSGSTTTTQPSPGDATYTLTCGTTGNSSYTRQTVTFITPDEVLQANSTDRLLGQPLTLNWLTWADSCTPSGGAPGDGWDLNSFPRGVNTFFSPNVTTLGTYTYTLTCSSGPVSVQQSVNVTIENGAPYVTTSVDRSSVVYSASPSDYITFSWISNLTNCTPDTNVPFGTDVGIQPIPHDSYWAQDQATYAPIKPGTYILTVNCTETFGALPTTSTPITVNVLPPAPPTATMSMSPASITLPQQFTLTWSSTNASGCTETDNSGISSGAVWSPGTSLAASGSMVLSPNEPGQFTFGVSCQSIDPNQGSATAQATLTISAAPSTGGGPSPAPGSSPPPASDGGGHGGGAVSGPEIGALAVLLLLQHSRLGRRRVIRVSGNARDIQPTRD
jgi:lysyl endopeptidase